ncbi:hypothetical protein K1719_041997 [Acacia pycnantha]|nr:hypothetical protein K1719_045530 [Acacia pycnantha]KAI9076063.1 hypothetical protein K1719_041997 [Acacia pycnantha]
MGPLGVTFGQLKNLKSRRHDLDLGKRVVVAAGRLNLLCIVVSQFALPSNLFLVAGHFERLKTLLEYSDQNKIQEKSYDGRNWFILRFFFLRVRRKLVEDWLPVLVACEDNLLS